MIRCHCHILQFDWTSIRLQESQQKHMTGIEEVAPNKSVQKNKDGKKTEEKIQEEIDP